MWAPAEHTDLRTGADAPPSSNPTWTINVSDQVRTVKVSNISPAATEKDIEEFFSFSGDIQYVEMQRETETSKLAYITFKDSQGVDTAILLTGSRIADMSISITPVENYQLPPDAPPLTFEQKQPATGSAVQKAEDVVSTMLAKGFILGKDALNKAKSFDKQHQLTSNASATVASLDQKMGLTEKLSIGTALVNEKVREMDERFQVSEKTKSAFAAAEQKASSAGSAIMSNQYVSAGASWFSSAIKAVSKAADGVSAMTKEKVEKERATVANDVARIHLDRPLEGEVQKVPAKSADDNEDGIV